jgi:hypothetical protein
MKPINLIFITLIFFNYSLQANPNFVENAGKHYDNSGNLIMPDKFFLIQALKSYQDGYNQSALTNFKKAAAFGNSVAQKYIGLMYIKALGVPRDWSTGYAWIKLAALDNTSENNILENKILKLLNPEELQKSKDAYEKLMLHYDQASALKRRDTWVRKQSNKMVGSYISNKTSNIYSYKPDGRIISTNSSMGYEQMNKFVEDFNFGYVSGGEIITLDESGAKED